MYMYLSHHSMRKSRPLDPQLQLLASIVTAAVFADAKHIVEDHLLKPAPRGQGMNDEGGPPQRPNPPCTGPCTGR